MFLGAILAWIIYKLRWIIVLAIAITLYFTGLPHIGGIVMTLSTLTLPVLLVGTFWFWALLIGAIIIEGLFVSSESLAGAIVTLLVTAVGLQWLTDVKVLTYVYAHPLIIGVAFGIYLIVGAGWSLAKWYLFLIDERDTLRDQLSDHRWKSEEDKKEFVKNAIPQLKYHKARIINWMSFWPWSMVWSLFSDFIYRAFQRMYQILQDVYEAMTKRVFREFDDTWKD